MVQPQGKAVLPLHPMLQQAATPLLACTPTSTPNHTSCAPPLPSVGVSLLTTPDMSQMLRDPPWSQMMEKSNGLPALAMVVRRWTNPA